MCFPDVHISPVAPLGETQFSFKMRGILREGSSKTAIVHCLRGGGLGAGGRHDTWSSSSECICIVEKASDSPTRAHIGASSHFYVHLLRLLQSYRWTCQRRYMYLVNCLVDPTHWHHCFSNHGIHSRLHLFKDQNERQQYHQHKDIVVHCFNDDVVDEHTQAFSNDRVVPFLSVFAQNPRCIIEIITEVLCERKVILVSTSLGLLSSCSSGLLGLLYPFKWAHDVIPMVPATMHHLFGVPTPYIYGIDPSRLSSVRENAVRKLAPGDSLMVVDLDSCVIAQYNGEGQGFSSNGLCGILPQISRERPSTVARDSLNLSSGLSLNMMSVSSNAKSLMASAKKASMKAPALLKMASGENAALQDALLHPKVLEAALVSEIDSIFSRSFGSEITKGLLKASSSVIGKLTGTAVQHSASSMADASLFQQDDLKSVSLQQAQALRASFMRFFFGLFGATVFCFSRDWAFSPEKAQQYIEYRCSLAMPQEFTHEFDSSANDENLLHFCKTTMFRIFGLSAAQFAKVSQNGLNLTNSCTFFQIAHRLGKGKVSSQSEVAAEVKQLLFSCDNITKSDPSSRTTSDVRRLVTEMTSNSKRRQVLRSYTWISEASFDSQHVPVIMTTILWRLQESQGINWRHATKASELLWHLICYGCDWLVSYAMAQCRNNGLITNLMLYKSDIAGKEAVKLVRHTARANFKMLADIKKLMLHKEKTYQCANHQAPWDTMSQNKKLRTSMALTDFKNVHNILGKAMVESTRNAVISGQPNSQFQTTPPQASPNAVPTKVIPNQASVPQASAPQTFLPQAITEQQLLGTFDGELDATSVTSSTSMVGGGKDTLVDSSVSPAASFHDEGFNSSFFSFDTAPSPIIVKESSSVSSPREGALKDGFNVL